LFNLKNGFLGKFFSRYFFCFRRTLCWTQDWERQY